MSPVAVAVWLSVSVPVTDTVVEGRTLAVTVEEGLGATVGDTEELLEATKDSVARAEVVAAPDTVTVPVAVAQEDKDGVGDTEEDTVTVGDTVPVKTADSVKALLPVLSRDDEPDEEGSAVDVPEKVAPTLLDAVPLTQADAVATSVPVAQGEGLSDTLGLPEKVLITVCVTEEDKDAEVQAVGVFDGV